MARFDVIGNIAVVKFDEKTTNKEKKRFSRELLKNHKNIGTVLEKSDRIKGRLRIWKLKYLAGENTRETIHTESGCRMKLNVKKCYFSPRMSTDRIEVAKQVKNNEKVLVMFSGIGPYGLVIAKNAKPSRIDMIEIGKECCKYARENIELNRVNNVNVIQGDVKRVIKKGGLIIENTFLKTRYDRIIMARPNLKDDFLEQAFYVSSVGTKINYHFFGKKEEMNSFIEAAKKKARKKGLKLHVTRKKKTTEIGPYKYRFRIDFAVG